MNETPFFDVAIARQGANEGLEKAAKRCERLLKNAEVFTIDMPTAKREAILETAKFLANEIRLLKTAEASA